MRRANYAAVQTYGWRASSPYAAERRAILGCGIAIAAIDILEHFFARITPNRPQIGNLSDRASSIRHVGLVGRALGTRSKSPTSRSASSTSPTRAERKGRRRALRCSCSFPRLCKRCAASCLAQIVPGPWCRRPLKPLPATSPAAAAAPSAGANSSKPGTAAALVSYEVNQIRERECIEV